METDAEFLGLSPAEDPGRFHFSVQNHLARLDGHLYGGTAIAVSIATAELVTERSALWMTTQFVSTAPPGEDISVHAEILAPGRRTNQVRVAGANPGGEVMFASLGATAHHRPDGLAGTFENPPRVTAPSEAEPWSGPFVGMARRAGIEADIPPLPTDVGFSSVLEFREPAIIEHPDPGPGRMCIWVRRRDRQAVTPALVAYMADMVPLSVAMASEVVAGGISLDNTIRIGRFVPTEWVLIDLRPHLAVGGYGHGAAHIWSERGHLLATASQSASMVRFDPTDIPWDRGRR